MTMLMINDFFAALFGQPQISIKFYKPTNTTKMKLTSYFAILLLLSGLIWTATAPTDYAPNDSESVKGVSVENIEEIFTIFDSDKEPGCAVSVFHEGETVYQNAFGAANLDYNIPLSDSSAFYMASVSKHVTAATAGLLVVRGDLDENLPVSEYINDWPDYAADVEIRHLFSHTSGLPDIYGLMDIAGIPVNNPMDIEDYMEVIYNGESLKFDPGTDYSYTNSGYTTLAYLVQEITEKSLAEFAEEEFFKPLGMKSTHFHDNRMRLIPNRAISYEPGGEHFSRTYLGMFQGVGPGGLYSTLRDWGIWESFWYGNLEWEDGITLQEANELKARMTTPAMADDDTLDYGWGLNVEKRKGQEMVGHGGSFMGFKTDYRRFPGQGYSFITLCNRGDADPEDLNFKLSDLFLQDQFEAYLDPFGGTFRNDELPIEYKLTVEDGNLKLNRRNSPNGFMTEEDKLEWSAGSWDFEFNEHSGEIIGFEVSSSRAKDVVFTRVD